jgi:NAD dependent epimerase/dehydratase family enzyme
MSLYQVRDHSVAALRRHLAQVRRVAPKHSGEQQESLSKALASCSDAWVLLAGGSVGEHHGLDQVAPPDHECVRRAVLRAE